MRTWPFRFSPEVRADIERYLSISPYDLWPVKPRSAPRKPPTFRSKYENSRGEICTLESDCVCYDCREDEKYPPF